MCRLSRKVTGLKEECWVREANFMYMESFWMLGGRSLQRIRVEEDVVVGRETGLGTGVRVRGMGRFLKHKEEAAVVDIEGTVQRVGIGEVVEVDIKGAPIIVEVVEEEEVVNDDTLGHCIKERKSIVLCLRKKCRII